VPGIDGRMILSFRTCKHSNVSEIAYQELDKSGDLDILLPVVLICDMNLATDIIHAFSRHTFFCAPV